MRFNGTLTHWNVERGSGVISAPRGGQRITVRRSDVAPEVRELVEGDELTFEIETAKAGKRRATRVLLAEPKWTLFADPLWPESKLNTLPETRGHSGHQHRPLTPVRADSSRLRVLALVLIFVALGWYALNRHQAFLVQLFVSVFAPATPVRATQVTVESPAVKPALRVAKPGQ